MYTPPAKSVIAPKQDLPCATGPLGSQPSKPAPVYQPAEKPSIQMVNPNPPPTVASLQNEISQITLIALAVSKTLGNTGPLRDLPTQATKIMAELKTLRAKK